MTEEDELKKQISDDMEKLHTMSMEYVCRIADAYNDILTESDKTEESIKGMAAMAVIIANFVIGDMITEGAESAPEEAKFARKCADIILAHRETNFPDMPNFINTVGEA